jgi:hypothetical protein
MTQNADYGGRYPVVEFVSAETMVNALEGYGVACESDDAATWVGELRPWNVKPDEDLFVVGIWSGADGGEFVGATDIRNFTKITVV